MFTSKSVDLQVIALDPDTDDDREFLTDAEAGFRKHAARDGKVDAYELKDILNDVFPKRV